MPTTSRLRPALLFLTLALLLPSAACADLPDEQIVQPDALAALLGGPEPPLLLDVRTPAEFAAGHVPTATLLPVQELDARIDELAPYKERGIVIYCESGRRATNALEALASQGFTNLKLLDGSMKRWRAEDRIVETGPAKAE